jgi:multidrug transporter EmrE-like cation transporter
MTASDLILSAFDFSTFFLGWFLPALGITVGYAIYRGLGRLL